MGRPVTRGRPGPCLAGAPPLEGRWDRIHTKRAHPSPEPADVSVREPCSRSIAFTRQVGGTASSRSTICLQPSPSARAARPAPTAVIVSQIPQIASLSKDAKQGSMMSPNLLAQSLLVTRGPPEAPFVPTLARRWRGRACWRGGGERLDRARRQRHGRGRSLAWTTPFDPPYGRQCNPHAGDP